MLVLTRKFNESILIGDTIEVRIVGIKGTGEQAVIRLGVVAPKDVTILRRELYDEVVAANQAAVQPAELGPNLAQELAPAKGRTERKKGL
jgi:carbon storage regulator